MKNQSTYSDKLATIESRRIKAFKTGNIAKWAYFTDQSNMQPEDEVLYEQAKTELNANPKLASKLEQEILLITQGPNYFNQLKKEQVQTQYKQEQKQKEARIKYFLQQAKQAPQNIFHGREYKINLLKNTFPDQYGPNGKQWRPSKTKSEKENNNKKKSFSDYSTPQISKIFEDMVKTYSKKYHSKNDTKNKKNL